MDGNQRSVLVDADAQDSDISAQLRQIDERILAAAIVDFASEAIQPALALATGPFAEAIEDAWQNEGVDCRIAKDTAADNAKVDVAVSVFAMTNDSPSQAKRHVEGLTSASDHVLFLPLPGRRSYGAERDAEYWKDLFDRRGFQRDNVRRKELQSDPRLPEAVREGLTVFRRASLEPISAAKPALAKRHFSNGISVILPVFNGSNFIAQAIISILVQTHRDFEFIIVDDGSTDRTSEIIENFAKQDDQSNCCGRRMAVNPLPQMLH